MKVSCVMPTYRRFTCVERSITFFLSQNVNSNKELIILNTDPQHLFSLDDTFTDEEKSQIVIINNNIDYVSGEEYTSTGAIRRDAFSHSTGEFYITWDDDDIFLPWNTQQCLDGILRTGKGAWKPYYSFMWFADRTCDWADYRNTPYPKLQNHFLEASAIVRREHVNFSLESGRENLDWYLTLKDSDNFTNSTKLDDLAIPGYCFNWTDSIEIGGGDKQSGLKILDNNEKFKWHREQSTDYAKRPFTRKSLSDYSDLLEKCNLAIQALDKSYHPIIEKYVPSYDYFIR